MPPSAVENRELPSKRYVISKYARKLSSNSRIDSPTIEIIGNDITRLRVSIDLWGKLGIRHTQGNAPLPFTTHVTELISKCINPAAPALRSLWPKLNLVELPTEFQLCFQVGATFDVGPDQNVQRQRLGD